MRLIINPALSFHPFHGDSDMPLAVCEVPDGSGRPRRYLVPQCLCDLLHICDGKSERCEAITAMANRSNGRYTSEQIEQLTNDFLIPRLVLLDPEASSQLTVAARRLDQYVFFKLRFLKREVVLPIGTWLQWLFHPIAWKCLVALILASHLWFYLSLSPGQAPHLDSLPNADLPWLLLALSVSTMLHEFGHATALTRFGGKNAEIGIGVYICFPALFVDLSDAWRLTSRQRVVVDLGGMYFQGMVLILLAIAFAVTGGPLWACCFLLTDIQIAANLNPLLRLDGYWAFADGLGIPNLRRRSMRCILFPMIKGRSQSPSLQTTPRTLRIMRIYLVCSLAFSAYLVHALFWQCSSIIQNYPNVLHGAVHSWANGSVLDTLLASLSALWRGLILVSIAVLLIRAVFWVLPRAGWPSSGRTKNWNKR
jgi:putative peptide zinc metalloprotease protein